MKHRLPDGYTLNGADDITRDEVITLFRDVGWEVSKDEEGNVHPSLDGGGENHSIGLRDNTGRLIAYGGLIKRDCEWAEMGDLVVQEQHRHRGLGRFLVNQRVSIADSLGVAEITIEGFENGDILPNTYVEVGFIYDAKQEVYLRRNTSLSKAEK